MEANEGLRQGKWDQPYLLSQLGLTELQNTLGIVGLGHIGTDLAFKARAFKMKIIYNDIVPKPYEILVQLEATYRDLDAWEPTESCCCNSQKANHFGCGTQENCGRSTGAVGKDQGAKGFNQCPQRTQDVPSRP